MVGTLLAIYARAVSRKSNAPTAADFTKYLAGFDSGARVVVVTFSSRSRHERQLLTSVVTAQLALVRGFDSNFKRFC